jgi:hypothetical protein
MAWYKDNDLAKLNFIVTGNRQAGCRFLQELLNKSDKIVCHADLLHEDEPTRKAAHYAYFGDSGKIITHYASYHISVEQYLNNKVFDNMKNDEQIVGIKLNYPTISNNDLFEYLDQKTRSGDFCAIHIVRNPVSCYINYRLKTSSEDSEIATVNYNKNKLYVDTTDLIEFVRMHEATKAKINRFCTDRLVLTYAELLFNLRQVLEGVFEFLEIPFDERILPSGRTYQHKEPRSQVLNWTHLKTSLPPDVLPFLLCDELI